MNFIKIILPLVVLMLAVLISYSILKSEEKLEYKKVPRTVISVAVKPLLRTHFQIWVNAQGTVTPRTESTLMPEVSGRVTSISKAFREGAFFETGQELLQIDSSNYQIAITVAESQVADIELLLAEEQAKARQAEKNWQRLGQGQAASDLVLRKPQLHRAKAALASAKALLKQARLNQQRTRIIAPYAGRVLEQYVDRGQYVSPNTLLAKIYAVDYAEIRLPLSNKQLQFIDIPELYRGQKQQALQMPEVTIKAQMGSQKYQWAGHIVRAEGAYDTRSRRLSLIAQVADPYAKTDDHKPPLKVGQFVEAKIKGKLLQQVFVIPRAAIKDNSQVIIVNSQSRLNLRKIDIIWRNAESVIINAGLQEGEWLCITPLQYVVNNLLVNALHNGKPIIFEQKGL